MEVTKKLRKKNSKHNAKELKRCRGYAWYPYFAWHPVKLENGRVVVFEWVRKRKLDLKKHEYIESKQYLADHGLVETYGADLNELVNKRDRP